MRLLLDESLPHRLKHDLSWHEVATVAEMGWGGTKNGDLLEMASSKFDVFITADQNLPYQQNIVGYDIGILILVAQSNRYDDLVLLRPKLLSVLPMIKVGDVVRISP